MGARHAAAVSAGTTALHLLLRYVGVGPGDEVICSTFTFVASANPIQYCGGAPVISEGISEGIYEAPVNLPCKLPCKLPSKLLNKLLSRARCEQIIILPVRRSG
ncbi:MAG: DegT/DnrJ/EryC1/StrS family aminotransferase [Desulfobulbaceae bacterium]